MVWETVLIVGGVGVAAVVALVVVVAMCTVSDTRLCQTIHNFSTE